MRLKSVFVSRYKNLRDLTVTFDGDSFIDVFVGKNGTGKSNLFEALIEIFRHIAEFDKGEGDVSFDYAVCYEIDGKDTTIGWKGSQLSIDGKARKSVGQAPLPDNVLIYYSGHNPTVAALVQRYEDSFRKRIKGADIGDSRRFIGIGPDYKALLLAVLLSQADTNKARKFVCQKLGIEKLGIKKPGTDEFTEPVLRIVFKRPDYAKGKSEYNIESNNETDRYWKLEGITKTFLDRLTKCIAHTPGEMTVAEGYFPSQDRYVLYVDIAKMQKEFVAFQTHELFQQFDNLRTLGMLADIAAPLQLRGGVEGDIGHFSDGQFQSVYIYTIVELFKDRSCVTLLDEPDAFLHPEWQFDFLKQVFQITEMAAKRNHVLMSSHSAVTLISHDKSKVKYFDISKGNVNCYDVLKTVAIRKLSSDLIKYSEQEQLLSIINTIQIERKPVLFTEGSTDPIILKEAWHKLYEEEMPFIPFFGFSCTSIKQLLTDNRIHGEMNGLPLFALFDFDKAFDQWNGLNGEVIAGDVRTGMIKKWASGESYAVMLPIPEHADVQKQVIRDAKTGETFGGDSCCEIEHLFYGQTSTAAYFHEEPWLGGGSKILFKSDRDKTFFAKEVVPMLDAKCFEPFRPMFEFIKSKCAAASATKLAAA